MLGVQEESKSENESESEIARARERWRERGSEGERQGWRVQEGRESINQTASDIIVTLVLQNFRTGSA
eukprot:6208513-Pleurochrysis_carterae.AAC.4